MRSVDVAIVGAGHGGVSLVGQLAKMGYTGSVAMIDAQPGLPYERPPLSKGYVLGKAAPDELLLRSSDYWLTSPVELIDDTTVTAVDPVAKVIRTDRSGSAALRYGSLVWAAGSAARDLDLPGSRSANVVAVRTRHDADRLARLAHGAGHALVVGGGYIGLEVAATLAGLGVRTSVVEAAPRLLARVAGVHTADWVHNLHRSRGVDIRVGTQVSRLETLDGVVTAAELTDGSRLSVDLVVVGVGVRPRLRVLRDAGLSCPDHGLPVDARCATALPDVYAIGDLTLQRNPHSAVDSPVRIESVPNAAEQAKVVAAVLTGRPAPPLSPPWFWSQQYESRLQTIGLMAGYDTEIVQPPTGSGGQVVGYFRNDRLIAADCVDAPRTFAAVRRALASRVVISPDDFRRGDLAPGTHPAQRLRA